MNFYVKASKYSKTIATRNLGAPSFLVEQPMCLLPVKRIPFAIRLTRWTTCHNDLDAALLGMKSDRYTCSACILAEHYGLIWTSQASIDPHIESFMVHGIFNRQLNYLVKQWNYLTPGWWLIHEVGDLYYKDLDFPPEETIEIDIGEMTL